MRGSCLCGAVVYAIEQLDSPIGHCSCRTCRKAHSAAFNSGAAVKHSHFKWLQGQEALKSYESSPGKLRYFCSNCGSQMVAQYAGKDQLILRVATLDDAPPQTPALHIFKSHEVSWLEYGPQITGHAEWNSDRK